MCRGIAIKERLLIPIITILVVILLDQITKAIIMGSMTIHETIEVIPGLFNIVHVRNPGAAFGILKDGGGWRTLFLIGISITALVIIVILIVNADAPMVRLSLSLIAGGAGGNLIDRIRFGEVVDFMDFHIGTYHWPAFNVADSVITIGVGMAILLFYRR